METFEAFDWKTFFAFTAFIISIISAVYSHRTLKNATLLSLFAGFDQANAEVMKNPNLLVTVHDIDVDVDVDKDDKDLKNIAYLAILIDAFHHYWGKEYNNKYKKVLEEKTNYIHKIVAVEDNYERWQKLKSINYGEADDKFVEVMDTLFKNAKEERKKVKEQSI